MVSSGDTYPAGRNTPPSYAVIKAVAAAEGREVTEISPPTYEPLHTVVDPEALDALFDDSSAAGSLSGVQVAFSYAGYDVIVHADGHVEISESAPADDSVNPIEE